MLSLEVITKKSVYVCTDCATYCENIKSTKTNSNVEDVIYMLSNDTIDGDDCVLLCEALGKHINRRLVKDIRPTLKFI